MSVENEILRIQHNIANTYAAVSRKGGEVPLQPTSANLAAAVESIPQGPTYTAGDGIDITETEAGASIGVTTPVRNVLTQAEYDALPEAERNKGLYVISDGGSGGGGSSGEVYSTDETRIGTWIDGKPLYRRAFQITLPETNDLTDVLAIEDETHPEVNVVEISGIAKKGNADADNWIPINITGGSAESDLWLIRVIVRKITGYPQAIAAQNSGNSFYAGSPAIVYLKYTKATDKGGTA